MLNWNNVLTYVKGNMAFPSTYLEKTDEELKDWIKLTALREFSTYFPDWSRTAVIVNNPLFKVDGKTNWFYFFDSEGASIIGIKECYFPLDNSVFTGHPIFGPESMYSFQQWALQVFRSKLFAKFSTYQNTYQFIEPNIVEILPFANSWDSFVVEYERTQPADLSKIPVSMEMTFMDLALSHTMILLGNVRSKYSSGSITTPFGTIELNGDQIRSQGEELKDKIIQRMTEEQTFPVIMECF